MNNPPFIDYVPTEACIWFGHFTLLYLITRGYLLPCMWLMCRIVFVVDKILLWWLYSPVSPKILFQIIAFNCPFILKASFFHGGHPYRFCVHGTTQDEAKLQANFERKLTVFENFNTRKEAEGRPCDARLKGPGQGGGDIIYYPLVMTNIAIENDHRNTLHFETQCVHMFCCV